MNTVINSKKKQIPTFSKSTHGSKGHKTIQKCLCSLNPCTINECKRQQKSQLEVFKTNHFRFLLVYFQNAFKIHICPTCYAIVVDNMLKALTA